MEIYLENQMIAISWSLNGKDGWMLICGISSQLRRENFLASSRREMNVLNLERMKIVNCPENI
jgi:hypothetical protein